MVARSTRHRGKSAARHIVVTAAHRGIDAARRVVRSARNGGMGEIGEIAGATSIL